MPSVSFEASQGWLNQVARIVPLSSPTLTLRIERPRRRKGAAGVAEHLDRDARLLFRLEARHRHDLAVAVAVREAERAGRRRSRCRRRPRPRRASARPPPAPAARRRGRSPAASEAGRRAAAPGSARRCRRRRALLGGEQPPPARLTAVLGLELDPVGHVRVELVERDRGVLAADHGDDLGPLGELLDRRRQGRAGAAPGDDLLADEADRVALAEAPLGVVAGSRGDPAGGDRRQRRLEPLGVLRQRRLGIELDQGQQARPAARSPRPPGPASRRARRRARRP